MTGSGSGARPAVGTVVATARSDRFKDDVIGRSGDDRGGIGARVAFLSAICLAIVLAGCSSSSETRPQLVVQVDTDAPLVGQILAQTDGLLGGPPLSSAVAIDTLRVDVIREDREVLDYRDVTVPDPRDWPVSFGLASQAGSSRVVRLRIRAFRASAASRGELAGQTTIEPPPNVVIDRIIDVEQPTEGVRTVRIVLAAACFGAPASFQATGQTCIDATRREVHPSEGVLDGSVPTSIAGTASEVLEQPCVGLPRSGTRCVPGGISVLGDPRLSGAVEGPPLAPQRPVLLSPFHMDETEFTVGRYRKLLQRGAVKGVPRLRDLSNTLLKFCSWRGETNGTGDDYPLNCVDAKSAESACEVEGGTLPTEAQWEHAARGRGRGYLFPWGNDRPSCCTASLSRPSLADIPFECDGNEGPEPVGSHRGKGCSTGDVSIDGVLDLGGSLREIVAEGGRPYGDPCWSAPGLVRDPHCPEPGVRLGAFGRGGDWSSGTFTAASALRAEMATPGVESGFRCVYEDRP